MNIDELSTEEINEWIDRLVEARNTRYDKFSHKYFRTEDGNIFVFVKNRVDNYHYSCDYIHKKKDGLEVVEDDIITPDFLEGLILTKREFFLMFARRAKRDIDKTLNGIIDAQRNL